MIGKSIVDYGRDMLAEMELSNQNRGYAENNRKAMILEETRNLENLVHQAKIELEEKVKKIQVKAIEDVTMLKREFASYEADKRKEKMRPTTQTHTCFPAWFPQCFSLQGGQHCLLHYFWLDVWLCFFF